jgi:hypothetical protein
MWTHSPYRTLKERSARCKGRYLTHDTTRHTLERNVTAVSWFRTRSPVNHMPWYLRRRQHGRRDRRTVITAYMKYNLTCFCVECVALLYCLARHSCQIVALIVVWFGSSVCFFAAIKALWVDSNGKYTAPMICHVLGDALCTSGHVHSVGGRITGEWW